jgi:hypothetical protein
MVKKKKVGELWVVWGVKWMIVTLQGSVKKKGEEEMLKKVE